MEPEQALERDLVELDDDAVDLVLHGVPVLAEVRDELPDTVEGVDDLVVLRGGQAPFVQQLVGMREPVDLEALTGADAVHHHVQRAGGGDLRVLLAQ